jgi:hypothetical protein
MSIITVHRAQPTMSKLLISVLTAALVVESGYLLLTRHPSNRFKTVDQDGFIAFDSGTGQLCKTFGAKLSLTTPRRVSAPSNDDTSTSKDPIMDAIRNAAPQTDGGEDPRVTLARVLPSCADIR